MAPNSVGVGFFYQSLGPKSIDETETRKKARTKTFPSRGASRTSRRAIAIAAPVEGTCGKSSNYTSTASISSSYAFKLCSKVIKNY
jgi:hypothetical protein